MRVLSLALLLFAACQTKRDLPKLYPVPATTLVNERGESVNLDAMKGNVVVYDFIFTSCTGTCPIMTNNMRAITPLVDDDAPVRFVSISIDPARDTPAVLSQYATRVRNDPRWTFLTGDRDAIVNLSVKGFKLVAGDPMPGGEPLLHSSKFAVADKQGVIRGYYEAVDGTVPEEVAKVVETLLNE
ncbi:MAG TPA: SCO family protein [Thermoanaerobaculia bacterium]|jgi:protein SCO1/2|nr:SCO family protein [Thermoanaerobaculia bacterium]